MGTDEPMREEGTTLPLGVRVTVVFLRIFSFAMFLPGIVMCLFATMALFIGASEANRIGDALIFTTGLSGTLLIVLMLALGSNWLARHLQVATTTDAGWNSRFERLNHPARQIFLPPLGCLMGFAFMAVLAWLPSISQNNPADTWPWPLVWGAIGTGAFFLYRHLDKILPR